MIPLPDVSIIGFGALDNRGIHTLSGTVPWDPDQQGPRDVKRSQVLSKIYPSFGKLYRPDRLAFSAASLALSAITDFDGSNTAITCCIPNGSLSTDRAYMNSVHSGTPSPALFSATLPSSPIADIAIYFKIKGPDRVFAGSDSPLLSALESAIILLTNQKCNKALFVAILESDNLVNSKTDVEGSDTDTAIALYITLDNLQPPAMKLQYNCLGNSVSNHTSSEREIFTTLLDSLVHHRSCRIPVSESGFKGYISLL